MTIGIRSVGDIVAEVVEASPLPANLADLHPQIRHRVEAEAKAKGVNPDGHWRDYRAHQERQRASRIEAHKIAREARRR